MKIYKYQLQITDRQTIQLPMASQPLSVQMQNGALCLWALVDPDARKVPYSFRIHGTGHDVPNQDKLTFIDTVQDHRGLVWHVFEEGE